MTIQDEVEILRDYTDDLVIKVRELEAELNHRVNQVKAMQVEMARKNAVIRKLQKQ